MTTASAWVSTGRGRAAIALAGVALFAVSGSVPAVSSAARAGAPTTFTLGHADPLATASVHRRASAANLGSAKSFKVSKAGDGTVVRWDPCSPIHYQVNLAVAPVGAMADVSGAIARLSAASGLKFVYDGTTSVIPQSNYGATMSPGNVPPMVIAWAHPGRGANTSNLLRGGTVLGVGGWRAMGWSDDAGTHPIRAASGFVVLDPATKLPAGFRTVPGGTRGGALLHELGHAVGLMHVSDTTQVMNPVIIDRPSYGNGDKAGLALVGAAAGCLP